MISPAIPRASRQLVRRTPYRTDTRPDGLLAGQTPGRARYRPRYRAGLGTGLGTGPGWLLYQGRARLATVPRQGPGRTQYSRPGWTQYPRAGLYPVPVPIRRTHPPVPITCTLPTRMATRPLATLLYTPSPSAVHSRQCPPGSYRQDGNIILKGRSGHCVTPPRMAGPRCPYYFPEHEIHTVFNSKKYQVHSRYLKAKGYFPLRKSKHAKNSENRELYGMCTLAKSRSTAGSIGQTRVPDRVVSASVLVILLSSVFRFPD